MTVEQSDTKVTYPYMSSGQWFGVRAKFRQSMPGTVDVDWIMAALGTSEKGARNVLPQLKAVGLLNPDGKPNTDLAHDLRDDDSYANACARIVERLYPEALRSAWSDPSEEPSKVAAWFMRNAGTGQATATNQAKLYLTLLKGELPSPEGAPKKSSTKRASAAPARSSAAGTTEKTKAEVGHSDGPARPLTPPGVGPNLHIDLQIHIAADASDAQIDTVFKSMAKHLYGRG